MTLYIVSLVIPTGNGTQSLIWQINEETYRQTLEHAYAKNDAAPGLQVYYGSLHDILSFPCEVRYEFAPGHPQ